MSEYVGRCIDMRTDDTLISAMPGVSRSLGGGGGARSVRCRRPCRRPGCSSGAGQGSCVLITHSCAWIGVAACDLDVPQIHACIQHGRDACMAEHMRV